MNLIFIDILFIFFSYKNIRYEAENLVLKLNFTPKNSLKKVKSKICPKFPLDSVQTYDWIPSKQTFWLECKQEKKEVCCVCFGDYKEANKWVINFCQRCAWVETLLIQRNKTNSPSRRQPAGHIWWLMTWFRPFLQSNK